MKSSHEIVSQSVLSGEESEFAVFVEVEPSVGANPGVTFPIRIDRFDKRVLQPVFPAIGEKFTALRTVE